DAAARPLLPAPLIFSSDPAATQLDTLSLHDALPISVLFYAALWSQGNHAAVLAGAAVAAVVLAIIAGVMLRVSMRLPFGTFFKRSEEHTSELQSRENLVCRLLLEKKKNSGHRVAQTH